MSMRKISSLNVSSGIPNRSLALLTDTTGPLIGLVRRAKSEAVKLLIDHGADVHDPDVSTPKLLSYIQTNALFRRRRGQQCTG